jgi:hypothetical protein
MNWTNGNFLMVRENRTRNKTVKRYGKGKKEKSDNVITLEKISVHKVWRDVF